MSADFSAVPALDYTLLSSPNTRAEFISQLRHALIDVGFLYLVNPPVSPALISQLVQYVPRLFEDLNQAEKDALAMSNSAQFLGYSRLGAEQTKARTDMREQYDFATEFECRWKPGDPEYLRLWGASQWPPEEKIPGFSSIMQQYLQAVQTLGYEFISLVSEALGLSSTGLDVFYNPKSELQHRAKVVKYPSLDHVSSDQGVGPHYDAGFLTFLLQASPHPGLQVQNLAGEWIDVPPIPNSFVINIGKALDTVTQGLARATSHRVLSPPTGSTPRYSIPFFQNVQPRVRLSDVHIQCIFLFSTLPALKRSLPVPPEILALKQARGQGAGADSVNFSEFQQGEPSGHVNLIGRVKSHPDVAQRHYPGLFKQYFPQGWTGAPVNVY